MGSERSYWRGACSDDGLYQELTARSYCEYSVGSECLGVAGWGVAWYERCGGEEYEGFCVYRALSFIGLSGSIGRLGALLTVGTIDSKIYVLSDASLCY